MSGTDGKSGVTARQLACVQAHLTTGSMKAAAHELGISPLTVRNHLETVRLRLGVDTTEQAVAILVSRGRLKVPTR